MDIPIRILVPQTILLPSDEVASLVEAVRDKWEMADDVPVSVEDIVREGINQGVIEAPDKFDIDEGYNLMLEPSEIEEVINTGSLFT
jgi:hypothetical protein